MKHAATIVAQTFGWDTAEAREHRYQDTRTPLPIFAIGEQYFAVSQTCPKWDNLVWVRHSDQFWAQHNGTTLWVAAMKQEEDAR
jgi:hypothetical protein